MFKKNLAKTLFASIMLLGLFFSLSSADVQNIKVSYCEDAGKRILDDSKLLQIAPGGESEICLNFLSNSDQEAVVTYGFAEGFLNDGGTQLCNANIEDNTFIQLFSNDNGNIRTFPLKPGESKMVKEKINIPIGMSGMIYGCMMHKIATPESDGMFTIVAMVKRHINIFVGGEADISKSIDLIKSKGDKLSSNNKIGLNIGEDGRATLSFLVKNQGNISQNVQIQGNMYNALGFEKTFQTAGVLVGPGQETPINSDSFLLPSYKGFFNVSIDMTATPSFTFNVDNLDPRLKEPTTTSQTGKFFIFSWIRVILGAIILILLILILRPLFKKHK